MSGACLFIGWRGNLSSEGRESYEFGKLAQLSFLTVTVTLLANVYAHCAGAVDGCRGYCPGRSMGRCARSHLGSPVLTVWLLVQCPARCLASTSCSGMLTLLWHLQIYDTSLQGYRGRPTTSGRTCTAQRRVG